MGIEKSPITNKQSKAILITLFIAAGFILAYPQAMMDIYLPVLPYLDKALNTSKEMVQYTVAFFLLGSAISQLISGVLSDRFGRVRILILGLLITMLGSALCHVEHTIEWMLVGRILQGIGAGMAAVLARVIVADSFQGKAFSKIYALLIAFSVFTVSISPVISGYLMQYQGWHSVVSFMFWYALIIALIVGFGLIIGRNAIKSTTSHIKINIAQVIKIMFNLRFLSATLVMFFVYGVVASVLLTYPYIFVQVYHMPVAAFGWVIALVILCMLIGAWLNSILLKKYTMMTLVKVALIVMFISMIGVTLSSNTSTYITDIICLSVFWLVYLWVYPNMIAIATSVYPEYKGTTIAIFSFIQIIGGFVFTALGAWHVLDTVYELGVTGMIGLLLALISFFILQRSSL
ncbi:MFS transporter [Cysteiniphilum sp. QT6929]|uniref:MFS transporter n=1 Tax=Cysteiniphilum sp. QT6929 TaxID=2975055 RepID=UPI0024B3BB2E|nr:MFS transporter [Cysteiniphilum sp. QT6929]WHN65654.1 MFS transporter [Cysteiniphilum sp. QT6929]